VTQAKVPDAHERLPALKPWRALRRRARQTALLAVGVLLLGAGTALADLVGLPSNGSQVNNDPAAGINPNLNAKESDVVGGSLTGGARVPWAVFRQQTSGADQVFSRSFAGGVWSTRGNGTVGGKSSANPTFGGSLNFDQAKDGEAPAIDFAGPNRAVPWATWYEHTAAFGDKENIFASFFSAQQNKWVFAGQSRGAGSGSVLVPSLNIHTDQDAENPSVAGGSAADATKPGPWVTWQETANDNNRDQIFVSRPVGPGQVNCDGVKPAGVPDGTGHVPTLGSFCFQQTGIPRAGNGAQDPSLNVDPTRNGVEPDIAFTGKNAAGVQDGVPWVVWYEKDNTNHSVSGLNHNNEMVFAVKGIADGVAANGGFHWVAVGNRNSATLDTSGANRFGGCAASDTAEAGCSLNRNPNVDAEDPRVAAGTLDPTKPTVPWVVWSEDTGHGIHGIFVSRLVGGDHFELFNNGAPIADRHHDSSVPDITFFGNVPYVSWHEKHGSQDRGFVGHFKHLRSVRNRHARRDQGDGSASQPGSPAGRRPGADLIAVHGRSVHEGRLKLPGPDERAERVVLPVHHVRLAAAAVRPGGGRRDQLLAVPGLQGHDQGERCRRGHLEPACPDQHGRHPGREDRPLHASPR
jgi:hypothetical protein